ncbi:MAG: helix-turn-helix domain-containing protein [Clostridium sp.]|nr:helix-turn-helix domain-containing protein [Clostridium sp.]
MRRISILWQSILAILCVLIIPTALISYHVLNNAAQYSEKNIAMSKLDNLESISSMTELVLGGYTRNVIQFANNSACKGVAEAIPYRTIGADMDRIKAVWNALDYLDRGFGTEKMVQSCFYLGNNSDYVISTDKGVCRVEDYPSLDWLSDEENFEPKRGIRGKWIARNFYRAEIQDDNETLSYYPSRISVLTYVYTVNPLISANGGTVVCNIYMSKLSEFMNPGGQTSGVCYILDEKNNVICHPDKAFSKAGEEERKVAEMIADSGQKKGYFDYEHEGVRYLCAYQKSNSNNWTYVASYNLEDVMSAAKTISYQGMMVIMLAIAFGLGLVVLAFYWLFRPFRNLLNAVSEAMTAEEKKSERPKNEIYYLREAFDKMKAEESEIHSILEARNSDTERLLLREILSGTLDGDKKKENLNAMFPYGHFIVLFIGTDESEKFLRSTNWDERMYFFIQIEELFSRLLQGEGYVSKTVYFRSTACVTVLNIKTYDQKKVTAFLIERIGLIKEEIKKIFDYTMTIGVSTVHGDVRDLNEALMEADRAMKHRIIAGKNQLIFWRNRMNEGEYYYYPYDSERKIVNNLKLHNIEAVVEELTQVREKIVATDNISYDNVVLIYQQLIGSIVRVLVGEKGQMSRFLEKGRKLYAAIAEMNTIEEIDKFIKNFIWQIQENLGENEGEKEEEQLYERILAFLNENYREDIDFEEAAAKMGVSYSHMRHVMREKGDTSLTDYINRCRINEAKELLVTTDKKLTEIAELVGYHNVQSLNRFFKKYEGTTPNSLRKFDK